VLQCAGEKVWAFEPVAGLNYLADCYVLNVDDEAEHIEENRETGADGFGEVVRLGTGIG
jgi:hypothetical protein